MKQIFLLIFLSLTIQTIAYSKTINSVSTYDQITKVLLKTAPSGIKVIGIQVANSYAIVSYTDGQTGGQAILKKSNSRWKIINQTGGGYTEEGLIEQGLTRKEVHSIARQQRESVKGK